MSISLQIGAQIQGAVQGIKQVNQELGKMPAAASTAATAFQRTTTASNAATFALVNTGRVLQDLPFGFISIANNINPLLESFQRLKQETGSTGAALKALISGIAGGGGLGLAVSAITAAISFATIGFSFFTRGLNSTKKELDDAAKSADHLKEVLNSLRSVSDIRIEASGGTEGEIARINALSEAVKNTNLSYKERKNALDQLKEANKSYFGDITLEQSGLEKLTQRVNEYTDAIIAAAVVKGFENEISRLAPELGKVNQAFNNANDAINKLRDNFTKIPKGQQQITFAGGGTAQTQAIQQQGEFNAEQLKTLDQINKEIKKRDELGKSLQTLRGNMAGLQDAIRDANIEALKFKPLKLLDAKSAEDEQKKIIELAKKIQSELPTLVRGEGLTIFDLDDLKTQFEKAKQIIDAFKAGFSSENELRLKVIPDIDFTNFKPTEVPEIEIPKAEIKILSPEFNLEGSAKGLSQVFAKELKTPEAIAKEFKKLFDEINNPRNFDSLLDGLIQIGKAGEEAAQKTRDDFLKAGKSIEEAEKAAANARKTFGGISQDLALAATAINGLLTPAFEQMILAIESGQNGLKAFFSSLIDSVKQLIAKLIAAAAVAELLSVLTGGKISFGSAFKAIAGFKAEGGPVDQNKPYVVGERGPEIFVPNSSGTIIPNNITKQITERKSNENNIQNIITNQSKLFNSFSTKNLFSTVQVPKFAEGGIVTKATLGVFGENGPEAILPLNQIKNIIGNQNNKMDVNVNVQGEAFISLDKLVLAISKAQRLQGFTS